MQRSELERACEDFSNIITSYPHYTVYKGTLSSGVEIAVVSTMITSSKEWSEHSESCFRKKVIGVLAHYMNIFFVLCTAYQRGNFTFLS